MRKRDINKPIVTVPAVLAGLMSGLMFVSLAFLLAFLPYYSYVVPAVYSIFPILFVIFTVIYIVLVKQSRRKAPHAYLLFSGIFSIVLPAFTSAAFIFGYPHVQHGLYMVFLRLSGFFSSDRRISTVPEAGHFLYGILAAVPGLIAGIVFLIVYFVCSRTPDDEYHPPRKRNYYYI